MGLGVLGWALVIGLLAAILVVLVRLLRRSAPKDGGQSAPRKEETLNRS